jgi:phosphatidylglycerophosphate synthase
MAASTQSTVTGAPPAADSRRAGRELVLEWVFQPLSSVLVPVLLRLRTPPPVVVLANAVAGLVAALAIARGAFVAAALLLQLKTLLDNTDGRLARASGRVTLSGRYLDTVADLVVNAVLFAALGYATGEPVLALAAFVALTAVLTVDFNVSELAREVHGAPPTQPLPAGDRSERLLGAVYATVFAPQDRLVRAVSERRYARAVGEGGSAGSRRAYFDPLTLSALANLGLTTQLAVLGVCLVLDISALYLWLAVACFVALIPLQLRRERLARREARP